MTQNTLQTLLFLVIVAFLGGCTTKDEFYRGTYEGLKINEERQSQSYQNHDLSQKKEIQTYENYKQEYSK